MPFDFRKKLRHKRSPLAEVEQRINHTGERVHVTNSVEDWVEFITIQAESPKLTISERSY